MSMDHEDAIVSLRGMIAEADRLCVLTGAGVSAESGVPTFRGDGGMWRNHDPVKLATPGAFQRNPALVWEFYNWRRALISKVEVNPAHLALVAMECKMEAFTLISQNVDGLHRLAGNRNIIEIHGSLWEVRCISCHDVRVDRAPDMGTNPRCDVCGGLLRPNVVWFGEPLDTARWAACVRAVQECDVMLVAGTSSAVQPVASLAMEAKAHGAVVGEVNLEPTTQTRHMDVAVTGRAGDILPLLVPE